MKRVEFAGCMPLLISPNPSIVTSKSGVKLNFKSFEARIYFVEHTHKPVILEQTPDGKVDDYVSDT
jgi:hypothetical protein